MFRGNFEQNRASLIVLSLIKAQASILQIIIIFRILSYSSANN